MGGLSPTIKIQTVNQFVILSFGVDPLNWPSFIEIGEIACSTPAWFTHGLTLKSLAQRQKSEIITFTDKKTTSQGTLVFNSDPGILGRGKKEAKICIKP